MQCMTFERRITLNNSKYIPFANDCTLFKRTHLRLLGSKKSHINMGGPPIKPVIPFGLRNETYFEKIPIFEKHGEKPKFTREDVNSLKNNVSTHTDYVNKIMGENPILSYMSDTWNSMKEFLSETIVKFIIYILICLVLVQICVFLVRKIITTIF